VLSLGLSVDVYLCTLPTDMRRGFDGLMRMSEEHLQRNVLQGGLFVFVNRQRDRVKLLYWDQDGLAIWYKKLDWQCPHFFLFTEIREDADNLAHRPVAAVAMDSGPPRIGPRRRPMSGEIAALAPPRAQFVAVA
jgi:hypothetical protein